MRVPVTAAIFMWSRKKKNINTKNRTRTNVNTMTVYVKVVLQNFIWFVRCNIEKSVICQRFMSFNIKKHRFSIKFTHKSRETTEKMIKILFTAFLNVVSKSFCGYQYICTAAKFRVGSSTILHWTKGGTLGLNV